MRLVSPFVVASMLSVFGCSSSDSPPGQQTNSDAGTDAAPSVLEIACTDAAGKTFAAPSTLAGDKGAVLACSTEMVIDKETLLADAKAEGYVGGAFASGAHVFRVQYVTERGNGKPGFSSAVVYYPDAPTAAKMPGVVVLHGTGGQAGKCATSQDALGLQKGGQMYMVRPLVGMGVPVIVPDYAGFAGAGADGNPLSGYAFSEDVGKSALDAARALAKMVPSKLDGRFVLVGHSQGGHTTLSALAMAERYAPELQIAAAVAYAPLWFSELGWGAMLAVPDLFPMSTSAFPIAVGVWYHYTHAEILDGPGKGAELFASSKRAAIKDFVEGRCTVDDAFRGLGASVADLYDPAFIDAIGATGITGDACDNSDPAAKAVCDRWLARYKADRPHLTGKAKSTPLLVLQGDADTTIPPDRAVCGFDRLEADGANVTFCIETGAEHTPLVYETSDYVSHWIAARVLGAPEPPKCARDRTTLKDASGNPIVCTTPPPNDKD